jgi:hypothetical protein
MPKRTLLAFLAISTFSVPPVFGQGCAMCQINAASQGSTAAAALNHGILVLLIPSLLMLTGVLVMIIRRMRP